MPFPADSRRTPAIRAWLNSGKPNRSERSSHHGVLGRIGDPRVIPAAAPVAARGSGKGVIDKTPRNAASAACPGDLSRRSFVHMSRHPLDVGISRFARSQDRIEDDQSRLGKAVRVQSCRALVETVEAQARALVADAGQQRGDSGLNPATREDNASTASARQRRGAGPCWPAGSLDGARGRHSCRWSKGPVAGKESRIVNDTTDCRDKSDGWRETPFPNRSRCPDHVAPPGRPLRSQAAPSLISGGLRFGKRRWAKRLRFGGLGGRCQPDPDASPGVQTCAARAGIGIGLASLLPPLGFRP